MASSFSTEADTQLLCAAPSDDRVRLPDPINPQTVEFDNGRTWSRFFTDACQVPLVLSRREREVLQLVAEGLTTVQIADQLITSKRTVETHRQNILQKTGCKNTASLISYAISHQLLPPAAPAKPY